MSYTDDLEALVASGHKVNLLANWLSDHGYTMPRKEGKVATVEEIDAALIEYHKIGKDGRSSSEIIAEATKDPSPVHTAAAASAAPTPPAPGAPPAADAGGDKKFDIAEVLKDDAKKGDLDRLFAANNITVGKGKTPAEYEKALAELGKKEGEFKGKTAKEIVTATCEKPAAEVAKEAPLKRADKPTARDSQDEIAFDKATGVMPHGPRVRDTQTMLKVLDAKAMPKFGVDGAMGPETTEAVVAFQKKHGIEPQTGKLDKKTQETLVTVYQGAHNISPLGKESPIPNEEKGKLGEKTQAALNTDYEALHAAAGISHHGAAQGADGAHPPGTRRQRGSDGHPGP